jgi:cytochrome c oxidase subunit 2
MTVRLALSLASLALLAVAQPAAADGAADEGRAVFMKNGCHGCHTIGKIGTPLGPDLSRVGFKYRAEYIERWLRDPSYMRPSAHMPALELTDADIRVLARYLSTLR